jgi:hypothetical protein
MILKFFVPLRLHETEGKQLLQKCGKSYDFIINSEIDKISYEKNNDL